MAVLLFEGWDLHVRHRTSHIESAGLWDTQGFPNWTHGSWGAPFFTDGYLGGQGMYWNGWAGTTKVGFTSSTEVRASWFGKAFDQKNPSSNYMWFAITHTSGESIGVRMSSLGGTTATCEVATFSGGTDFDGTVVSSSFTVNLSDWAQYDFYVNKTTGAYVFKVDNDEVAAGTATLESANNFNSFQIKAPGDDFSNQITMIWDHLVITDGESLQDTIGYHAVAVTWHGTGVNTGSNTGVRGRINVNETTYYGTTFEMGLASVDKYSPWVSNVYYAYWMENPDTSAAWGNEIDIDSWGLCRTDNTGGHLTFANAALFFVEMHEDGYPLVRYQAPAEAILVDDTWVRTHEATPWHEHLDNYPREFPSWDSTKMSWDQGIFAQNPSPWNNMSPKDWSAHEYDEFWNEDYLGCTGPGCITFSFEQPEPPTTYGGTGLAFAEEYRTTYKDWQSIIDGGEEFTSYFISGYKIHGEGNKKFQDNYLTMNFETDVLGSAYVQGVWDYALGNTPNDGTSRSDTGRWGTAQQVYGPRNSVDYKHAFSKLKIRGHGKALQLKVKSESGKPFYINGWAMFITGNSTT